MKLSKRTLAVIRIVAGVLSSVYAVLSAQSVAPHLPPSVLTPLALFGPAMIILQHWLADPTTGNAIAIGTQVESLVRAELAKILGLDAPAAAATVKAAAAGK